MKSSDFEFSFYFDNYSGIIKSEPDNIISCISAKFNEEIRAAAIECITYDEIRKEPVVDRNRFNHRLAEFKEKVKNQITAENKKIRSLKEALNILILRVWLRK